MPKNEYSIKNANGMLMGKIVHCTDLSQAFMTIYHKDSEFIITIDPFNLYLNPSIGIYDKNLPSIAIYNKEGQRLINININKSGGVTVYSSGMIFKNDEKEKIDHFIVEGDLLIPCLCEDDSES